MAGPPHTRKVISMKVLFNDGHVDEVPADEELHVLRHSAAHIMAQAIKRLYPQADFAYGPATDNGFYYDIDLPEGTKISDDDFPAIEDEMRKICKENLKFETYELPRAEAIKHMEERGEKYKVEHIGDLPEDARITFYKQGEYVDMCVGPHILYTKALKAFKLTGVSGAYWKGDSKNKMLARINGVAFRNKQEMDEHFALLAEAEKRDHRKIGQEMEIFMMNEAGPGFPFWLPNGMRIRNSLMGDAGQVRLRPSADPHHPLAQAVGDLRSLGPLQREHVHHEDRRRGLRDQANELPRRLPHLQEQAAQLP